VDTPLAIRALKRYIADNMDDYEKPMVKPVTAASQVAIIGSGPAGLSCAYFLALLGRSSVIFEAQPIPGGMLTLGIPEFRLPKETLKKEIDFILSHGIELRTGTRIDNAQELLKKDFKAVFVATGAQTGKPIDIEGIQLDGVVDAMGFLRDRALGKGLNCEGKKVVVLGGGNAAVDAARSAVRLGAEKVTILYRRTRQEMPAYEEEIEEALGEGIELVTLAIPKRITGKKNSAAAIEFIRAELGTADADGRRRPVPIEGSETTIECDMVIPGIGQVVSTESVDFEGGAELTDWGSIKVDPVTYNTSVKQIFSAGDCVTGPSSVIGAIAGGQKAAVNIDKTLGGTGILPEDRGFCLTRPDEEALAESLPRIAEQFIPLKQRKRGFAEVVLALDRTQAGAEARRCLRCDLEK
jgi:NADH-quinone oxidoreductase subunit F